MKIKKDSIITPIPTEEEIYQKAKNGNIKFPKEFVNFLLKYNCAEPEDLEIKAEDGMHLVTRFLGIVKREYSDAYNRYYDFACVESTLFDRLCNDGNRRGMSLVPIAELFAGDYLCLDYIGRYDDDNPPVCVWSHDESGEFDPITYYVADSFGDFLKNI